MGTPLGGVEGELHVLAARAAVLAAQVRERSAEVRACARTGWRGAAAEAYARAAVTEAARLDRCAERLDDLVVAMRGHARGAGRRLDEVAELFTVAGRALETSADLLHHRGGGW